MLYFFLILLAFLLALAVFFGSRHFSIFLLSNFLLLLSFYFLFKGDSNLSENFAQLFFASFLLTVVIFRSPRFLSFLRKFFED